MDIPNGAAHVVKRSDTVVLSTARLTLAPHTLDDFEDCVSLWSDPEVVRHISGRPFSREEIWQRLLRYAGHWCLRGFGFWVIRETATGEFLGEIGIADFKRDLVPSFDAAPECGWALLPGAQGRGVAGEALEAVISWAEARLDAERIVCLIDPANQRSIRLALRLGFVEFGTTEYKGSTSTILRRTRRTGGEADEDRG